MKRIVIIGGGGHARVAIDAIKRRGALDPCGVVDPNIKKGSLTGGVKVLGGDDILPSLFRKGVRDAFIGIGCVGDCALRKRIYKNLKRIGFRLPVVIHPSAVVAEDVKLGEGVFVSAGAVINPGTKIGNNAIINTSSSIDHDCRIGDFAHIAPGAVLSGGVRVGDQTHIGMGANIAQYVNIGKNCVIGAGTTVRKDMAAGEKNFGPTAKNAHEKE